MEERLVAQTEKETEVFGLWVVKDRLLPWDFLGLPALRSPFPSKEVT